MHIFMPVFLAALLAALAVYIFLEAKDRMQKVKEEPCRLARRERRKNPHQTLIGRRDKVEYRLVFVPEDAGKEKREIPMVVRKEVYRSVPKMVPGVLKYQGSRFVSFSYHDITIFSYSPEIPFDHALQEEAKQEWGIGSNGQEQAGPSEGREEIGQREESQAAEQEG